MSIVALMQDAAVAAAPAAVEAPPGVARRRHLILGRRREQPAPASTAAAIASQLTTYIPTEAVAVYTAILPFLTPKSQALARQDYTGRWVLAGGVALFAVLFSVGIYKRELEARGGSFRWPPKRTATVLLAFVGWVFVVPGSPFGDFEWYTPAIGAAIGLALNALISLGTLWFGGPEEP